MMIVSLALLLCALGRAWLGIFQRGIHIGEYDSRAIAGQSLASRPFDNLNIDTLVACGIHVACSESWLKNDSISTIIFVKTSLP
jgi:hypothetical protein